jgi:hypothetical protein
MPPRAAQPSHGTESTRVALCDIPLYDAEGTEIPLWCRVEQVAVDKAHGAHPARLHQQGQVIGQSAHLVYVLFDDYQLIALRPHLVRVLGPIAS